MSKLAVLRRPSRGGREREVDDDGVVIASKTRLVPAEDVAAFGGTRGKGSSAGDIHTPGTGEEDVVKSAGRVGFSCLGRVSDSFPRWDFLPGVSEAPCQKGTKGVIVLKLIGE